MIGRCACHYDGSPQCRYCGHWVACSDAGCALTGLPHVAVATFGHAL